MLPNETVRGMQIRNKIILARSREISIKYFHLRLNNLLQENGNAFSQIWMPHHFNPIQNTVFP